MRGSFTAAALLAGAANAQLYPGQSKLNHTCQLQNPLLSCPSQNATDVDSCCVETFGGLVLSTQFWSTYTGLESQSQLLPKDTWSLHGLYVAYINISIYEIKTPTYTSLVGPISAMARTHSTVT